MAPAVCGAMRPHAMQSPQMGQGLLPAPHQCPCITDIDATAATRFSVPFTQFTFCKWIHSHYLHSHSFILFSEIRAVILLWDRYCKTLHSRIDRWPVQETSSLPSSCFPWGKRCIWTLDMIAQVLISGSWASPLCSSSLAFCTGAPSGPWGNRGQWLNCEKSIKKWNL